MIVLNIWVKKIFSSLLEEFNLSTILGKTELIRSVGKYKILQPLFEQQNNFLNQS